MKKFILAAAVLAATAASAEAKCSKAALDGEWMMFSGSNSTYVVTIANGVLNAPVIGAPVNVAMSKTCRGVGSVTSGMNTYKVRFTSERISATSSLKPNLLMMAIEYSPGSGSGFILYRKK